jgi:cytochrome c oxidase subunit 2
MTNIFLSYILPKSFCDAPEAWQLYFQEPATPVMEGIVNLHNDLMAILTFIGIFTGWMFARTCYLFSSARNKTPNKVSHGKVIELVWTILPSFILITIAVPSFALLYSMDEVIDPAITLKVIGHQWYWSYEYSDYNSSEEDVIAFDSYMIAEDDLEIGQLRLLEVDNRVILPINTHIRVLITSTDVIHAWAIPSLGIKCDAYPGRLNQVNTFIKREGIFHGQCSELCGVNHGFMPIVVEAVSLKDYVSWVSTQLEE